MPLSWTEIKQRAITFSRDWSDATRENADAQTFWNEFFEVFGVRRRTVASFEEPVRNLAGQFDRIDLFWKGRLIAEHKSRGRDLAAAASQALDYVQSLARENRAVESPRYILVSDFARFALHDLEETDPARATLEFDLADFPRHARAFAFIAGYETRTLDPEDDANFRATELLAHLHDTLEEGGYAGHDLERFLVRILFCLFAEDTGIFEPQSFGLFITNHTRDDGADLGPQLARLFQVLNTPLDRRQANLDPDLASLPYVNGQLFAENLSFPEFNSAMRTALLSSSTSFHWEKISPAVFGSLFQSIMQPRQRRQIGAHYTSERDILKLIRSLFLDDLRAEFDSIQTDRRACERFHRKLASLNFLDPACGCGNFLVIAYRELRRLELDLLNARFGPHIAEADVRAESRLNVSQFYGIEIEEWPARIAEVAMWLMDHQMNQELFQRFSQIKPTTPLTKSPHILHANALRTDWNDCLPADQCSYVLGNPPFVGKHYRTNDQRDDLLAIHVGVTGASDLDYVSAWYRKAAEYIQGTGAEVAFVSTNSITQGEQAAILWPTLLERFHIKLRFAHRTFHWESEARGKAHVHVVIVGFELQDRRPKQIYDYEADPDHPNISSVSNISPYLVEGPDGVVTKRQLPFNNMTEMRCGNKPTDGGHLLLTEGERGGLLASEPGASKFLRRFTGSEEFINGNMRWCLWLKDASPGELRDMPLVMKRIQQVREFRLKSTAAPTRRAAETPTRFFYVSQPDVDYILIPEVSSERRKYIPIGFVAKEVISANTNFVLPSNDRYLFGILTSSMHMAWARMVGGRLKSDYRYSRTLIYNTFPWPESPTDKQKQRVKQAAQAVLDARAAFPGETLASLYNPLTMPPPLARAHAALDTAVDRCYRPAPFPSDRHRFEYLFSLYEQLTSPLLPAPRRRRSN